jgi:hypothetical protein
MCDYISRLPAPLLLYVLLELPDLKALYAAILSSPHFYATFRLDAHRLFSTIADRTIADDINTAIHTYIYLQEHLYEEPGIGSQRTLQDRLQAASSLHDQTKYAPIKASAATLLIVIAQAVRIHDIGFCILASKLDYLVTLRPQKLSDPV